MDEASIFLDALKKPAPDERAAFLDQACGGNDELRRSVELLLRAHDKAGGFLAGSPAPVRVTVDQPITESPGTVIGPYKLIEQIGEGGMGTVWMAQQTEPVKRMVALKLIKAGMDSKQVIARFEAERQALALMDHANIARVLDAGTTGGRPYFVMDLVKGVPITKYCDEHRLTPRQRLELFVPVCQAVQHAHQKGIIHRDLKPSNVLVALYDGKPVPKIIDFGVAKAAGQPLTEKTLVTGFGNIVGTLEYMSPEQAEVNQLDIDTRSDIYSLGVLLYELLAGSPPFTRKDLEKAGMLEMLRVIREQEPSKPSTKLSTADGLPILAANRGTEPAKLTKLVRGDLDWIVMKALEKDRTRRYETANGFAMDLLRYLADEAVLACPPSVGYRLRKLVRRNKRVLATLLTVAFAVVLAAGTLGWALRDRAAREQQAALEEAARRTALEQNVSAALEKMEEAYQRDKLPEALAALSRAEGLLTGAGTQNELRPRLNRWRADLEMLTRLEAINLEASALKDERFDIAGAEASYREAFQRYGLDIETSDRGATAKVVLNSAIKERLVAALDQWLLLKGSAKAGGEENLLALAQLVDPDPWRGRLRDALRRRDGEALLGLSQEKEFLAQAPAIVLLLAQGLCRTQNGRQACDILYQAQRRYAGDFWINAHLAWQLRQQKRLADATTFCRAAVALRPDSAGTRVNLGSVLHDQGRIADAEAEYREAIRLQPNYATAHYNLANALGRQGKHRSAEAEYRRALHINPKYAEAYVNLGIALYRQDRLAEAEVEFQKAISLKPTPVEAYDNLARLLLEKRELARAEEVGRKAVGCQPQHAPAHHILGLALEHQGKTMEAEREYSEAVRIKDDFALAKRALERVRDLSRREAQFRDGIRLRPDDAAAHYNLGAALEAQGRLDEAESQFRAAIRLKKDYAEAYVHLSTTLWLTSRRQEALVACEQAIRLEPELFSGHVILARWLSTCPEPKLRNPHRALEAAKKAVALTPQSAFAWQMLGWAQYRVGDWMSTIEALEKSMALHKNPKGGSSVQWFFLAMAHERLGNHTEAVVWYDRAALEAEKNVPDHVELRRIRMEAAELLDKDVAAVISK